MWPVIAETINMADGLDDDEEEQFLRDNADLLPFCSIDVACIAAEYSKPGIGVYPITLWKLQS